MPYTKALLALAFLLIGGFAAFYFTPVPSTQVSTPAVVQTQPTTQQTTIAPAVTLATDHRFDNLEKQIAELQKKQAEASPAPVANNDPCTKIHLGVGASDSAPADCVNSWSFWKPFFAVLDVVKWNFLAATITAVLVMAFVRKKWDWIEASVAFIAVFFLSFFFLGGAAT